MIMDNWMQCLTMIASFSGLVFFLNKNHREDLKKIDDKTDKIDAKIDKMDAKWDKLFNLFVELKLWNEK